MDFALAAEGEEGDGYAMGQADGVVAFVGVEHVHVGGGAEDVVDGEADVDEFVGLALVDEGLEGVVGVAELLGLVTRREIGMGQADGGCGYDGSDAGVGFDGGVVGDFDCAEAASEEADAGVSALFKPVDGGADVVAAAVDDFEGVALGAGLADPNGVVACGVDGEAGVAVLLEFLGEV